MTPSPATAVRPATVPVAALLAALTWISSAAVAQTYRIDTILGDYDPLAVVPLAHAWVSNPSSLATDSRGNVYFVDRDTYRVRKVDQSGQVSTVAGSGLLGFSGDGGPATSAKLGERVEGLAVDDVGNVYIADTANYRIRRVDPSGTIDTIAGTGSYGGGGDGGPAAMATLGAVYGLATDAAGNLYIADTFNDKVRKISPDGIISRFAGTGEEGHGGDGGPAGHARLDKPRGLAVDESGHVYIADTDNHRIRRVDPSGTIATVAGNGHSGYGGDGGAATAAMFDGPHDVAVDASGIIYVADSRNRVVRRIDAAGILTTVAGVGPDAQTEDDGADAAIRISFARAVATDAEGAVYIADSFGDSVLRLDDQGMLRQFVGAGRRDVHRPGDVAIDASGNILVADSGNHRIIRVDPFGVVTTVAGTGQEGATGDGEPATSARFASPRGVATDDAGNVYIADSGNHRIRMIGADGTVKTIAGTGDEGYGGDGGKALSASFDSPTAIAVGPDGSVYIADCGNRRIRRLDTAGVVTTVAGNGERADPRLDVPATESPLRCDDVAVDSMGRVYMPDRFNHRVLMVDLAGVLVAVAGTGDRGALGDGGPATSAEFWFPGGVAVSDSDALYIADTWNHTVRRGATDGRIATIAGFGSGGYTGEGAPATEFRLSRPSRLAAASDERVVVIDSGNGRVRVLTREAPRPEITSVVNGASFAANVSPGSVEVIRGSELSSGISAAKQLPRSVRLPTALLETSVIVADRTETSWARREAGLYSVAPTEIRFLVPERAAVGLTVVHVVRDGVRSRGRAVQVTRVAPALFSADGNGRGVAAASASRVARDGTGTALAVARYDSSQRRHVAVPLDLRRSADPVYLTVFGTGMRGAAGRPVLQIGGLDVAVTHWGPASGFHGLDELVAGPLPRTIRGGDVEVVASVDGLSSNAVTIAIK